jgi:hypothetical protein
MLAANLFAAGSVSAPVEIDEETRRELDRIEQAVLGGDVRFLDGYGGLQAVFKRVIALEKRARRRAGRRLTERVDTWRTDRLEGARIWWEPDVWGRTGGVQETMWSQTLWRTIRTSEAAPDNTPSPTGPRGGGPVMEQVPRGAVVVFFPTRCRNIGAFSKG